MPDFGKQHYVQIQVVKNGYSVDTAGTAIPWVFRSFEELLEWLTKNLQRGEE